MAANFYNLRDFLLPVANFVRQLPSDLGLRLYTITVRVTQYPSGQLFNVPGLGTPTVIETPLFLDGYGTLPYVRNIKTSEVVASGGLYLDTDLVVKFITPYYNNIYGEGGIAINILDPEQNAVPTEVLFIVQGPNLGTNGALFKKIQTHVDKPFSYSIILRKVGVAA